MLTPSWGCGVCRPLSPFSVRTFHPCGRTLPIATFVFGGLSRGYKGGRSAAPCAQVGRRTNRQHPEPNINRSGFSQEGAPVFPTGLNPVSVLLGFCCWPLQMQPYSLRPQVPVRPYLARNNYQICHRAIPSLACRLSLFLKPWASPRLGVTARQRNFSRAAIHVQRVGCLLRRPVPRTLQLSGRKTPRTAAAKKSDPKNRTQ